VIPPGVDPIRFESAPSPELVKEKFGLVGKRIILFVGRLAKRKGVKEFIDESLMTIAKEVPNVCFVIVGDNPSESLTHREDTLSEIKRIISDMSLQNYIRLLGSLNDDEVIELYQACDVFVLPTLATTDDVEGFGIVLLEAAAAGKVVVATRVGGIPDAVEDGKSGILVEAGDHAALQREIIDLLRDDCRRLDMAAYARERVMKQFSWNRIFERYTTILGLLMTPTGSE
jgi:phosphatidyl-myo-inositol dimannoside synthase